MNPQNQPVGELAKVLASLHKQTRIDVEKMARSERNRFNLLLVHATAAQFIAILFCLSSGVYRGPIFEYLSLLPGFPYSFGAMLGFGGMVLLPAAIAEKRTWEIAGLYMIYVWYLLLSIGLAIPIFKWLWLASEAWRNDEPTPGNQPALYAFVVYLHLAIIMRVHIATLRRMGKEERASRADERLLKGA